MSRLPLRLLLAQSYAPEPNPGPRPVKFPCAICEKAVKWTPLESAVTLVIECMGMPECVYKGLTSIRWECFKFGVQNLSTGIFHTDTTIFEDSNSFSPLIYVFSLESDIRFNFPNATLSPSRPIQESPSQFENRIMTRVYIRSLIGSTMYQNAPLC